MILIVGGSGIAPVRPIIEYFYVHPEEVKSLKIIVGFKNIEGLIFKDEFDRWKEKFDVLITLDNNEGAKDMNQGMVTKYIPDLFLPEDTSDYEICSCWTSNYDAFHLLRSIKKKYS